jgi:hypothetical protein
MSSSNKNHDRGEPDDLFADIAYFAIDIVFRLNLKEYIVDCTDRTLGKYPLQIFL